ncbi:MAG: SUMF1/EgtB/PvdO family nonheme iron enzyme [Deltaproteobacteria bacterium]|nr:SUMF1/EgtB/PvdO family nonheme iron enzyme [Deltaproteobacteria bacterium]
MTSRKSLSPPREFDGYQLIRRLGKGGMGEVHKALDTLLDRFVAIKFITTAKADEIARTRFLLEARAFARLQHPNVVSIYRVGEVLGFPYLVSEYVQGKPLDGFSFRRADVTRIIQIASGIARGLAAAHKQGVIHRDIKPGNIMVTDSGEAKILDFGIAKLLESMSSTSAVTEPVWDVGDHLPEELLDSDVDILDNSIRYEPVKDADTAMLDKIEEETPIHEKELTRPGTAIGTPRYMAPEVWRGKEATFRSDVYSFGALLFFLCTGESPHNGKTAREIGKKCVTTDAPPLQSVVAGIHPGVAEVVNRCLRRNPVERYANGNEVRMALAQLTPEMRTEVSPEGNPYRGLHPFEQEHRNLFFGRDSEIRLILERLKSEPLVVVAGDSGIGKSSLCRAGIMPRVESWMSDRRNWRTMTIVPGAHPLVSFSASLCPFIHKSEKEIEEAIRLEPANIARMIRSASGPEGGLLIFIDQLEELITVSEKHEAEAVAELLKWLSVPTPGVRLLATVRGDYLANVAALPQLSEQISTALFFVRPMNKDRVAEAIVGPANAKGVTFESDELVKTIVDATVNADGGLPLLQFALRELWEARDQDIITSKTLKAIGGVEGALSRHADDVYDQLSPQIREAAREVMIRLVTAQRTRSRKTIVQLNPESSREIRDAIHYLTRGRLIVVRETKDGAVYEIAHESLLTGWKKLADWLSSDTESSIIKERLHKAAEEWTRLKYAGEALWEKTHLKECQFINEDTLDEMSKRFLRASRQASRNRRIAGWLLILLVPVSIIFIYTGGMAHKTDEQTQQVTTEAELAQSLLEQVNIQLTELKNTQNDAQRMYARKNIVEAERRWERAIQLLKSVNRSYEEAARHLEAALLLDEKNKTLRRLYGKVLFERAVLAVDAHNPTDALNYLSRLPLFDDGLYQSKWVEPGTVSFHITHGEDVSSVKVELLKYVPSESGNFAVSKTGEVANRTQQIKITPGSYLAIVKSKGGAPVQYPFVISRGERLQISFELPASSTVPENMQYIPAGNFYFGASAPEEIRIDVLHTLPLQRRATSGFLISRFEVTFEQWLTFLDDEQDAIQKNPFPFNISKNNDFFAISISENDGNQWVLRYRPRTVEYIATEGEPIDYVTRKHSQRQDWLQMPVSGITWKEAKKYAAWLDMTGELPGARLCTELEWERAARGADARIYPHGNALQSDDANYADTFGRVSASLGPNEVGQFPDSVSPFNLNDMAGNVQEWTISAIKNGEYVLRGGSYAASATALRVMSREIPIHDDQRDVTAGFRICADW